MLPNLPCLRVALLAICASIGLTQKPAPPPPPPATQQQIDAAIDTGAKFLLAAYADRIVGGQLEAQERIGQSALSLYTLLKAGVSKDDATVRRLVTHILGARIDQTYDATCAILALSAHDAIDNRRWIGDLARKLISWQQEGGDWSYPGGLNDLSNTQYAALGLWVAAVDGVPIDASVWTKLATAAQGYEALDGSFSYGPAGSARTGGTGSMTAAGVGTLAICEMQLRCGGSFPSKLADDLASARARGFDWLAHNFSVTTNPRSGGWLYYYLYGLERLGALSGVALYGTHDWYIEGATYLVAEQAPTGSWQRGADLSDTCFAILFLKRATSPRRGPITGELATNADSDPPLRIASDGNGVVRVWIAGWNRKLAHELEWPGDRGRGPRVTRVEYLADDKLCSVKLGDPLRADSGESFGANQIFEGIGKHHLMARAFVLAPGEKLGSEKSFDSQVLEIEVARARPKWSEELNLDLGPNLALDAKAKVKASSRVKLKEAPMGLEYVPDAILDGSGATPWLADTKDDQRTLAITLIDAPTCNVIRISAAVLPAFGASYLSRPIELEVAINGKDKQRLAMDPDPLHPMRIELAHKTIIKRIDIKITASAASEACALVGIGEVELFLRKE